MKITITIHQKSPVHTGLRLHVNGALSGNLVLRNEEYDDFVMRIKPERIYNNVRNPIDNLYKDDREISLETKT